VKLIARKISWRARLADKHSKTQTATLGATTQEKVNEQLQNAQSFFYDIVRSFMNIN